MTITLAELAQALDARLWGDGSLRVSGAAEPSEAGLAPDGTVRVALAMTPAYAETLSPGGAALLAEGMDPAAYDLAGAVIVPRPRLAMAALTRSLDRAADMAPGVHPTAVIDPSAQIGAGAATGIAKPSLRAARSAAVACWMACMVASMLTTTPRLSPRDSCEPMPMTSIGFPGEYSPTSATTLEVPISRPTMRDLSPLKLIGIPLLRWPPQSLR